MTKKNVLLLIFLGLLLSSSIALAGSNALKGKSSFELNIGLWHESKVANEMSRTGIISTAKSSGFVGGLSYVYWPQEDFSISFSVGVLSGEATSTVSLSGASQRSSSVIPILLGIRYYIPESSVGSPIRPLLAVGVGPFIGVESKNELFSQESRTETAFGAWLGAGVDLLLSQSFKLGANIGYNFMTDFSTSIGARKNYNGPEFSLDFGFIFGGSEP